MIEQRYRFTLTKRQVQDLEDNLLLDDDIVSSGIEQPVGHISTTSGTKIL